MNEEKLTVYAITICFCVLILSAAIVGRRRERGIAGVMPVMIVNPDGSPVHFGQEPLILTDRKKE